MCILSRLGGPHHNIISRAQLVQKNNSNMNMPPEDRRPSYQNADHDNNMNTRLKNRVFTPFTVIVAGVLLCLYLYISSPSANDVGTSLSSIASRLRPSSKTEGKAIRSPSPIMKSPYEQIWVNYTTPLWVMKKQQFRDIEYEIPPSERICFVHVGKAGGSSVGCGLGFTLHCHSNVEPSMEALLPRRATRMFHTNAYDCHDDSAYFLFVVRNPVERIRSAFLYERPNSEEELKKEYPDYYENRKSLYLDCPSFGVMESFVQEGMTQHGNASEVCKTRALSAVRGDMHLSCHMYFNYQFHLEGVPTDANILVIRNEHLIQDWNSVEHYIGGVKEIIPPEKANETMPVMNKSDKDAQDKWLSEESTNILCENLCNEIVNYKKILRRSLNLNYQEVIRSIEELRVTCPKYADYEEGDCPVPMPDITAKLKRSRGYEDGGMKVKGVTNR
jgi:hypothetical protein